MVGKYNLFRREGFSKLELLQDAQNPINYFFCFVCFFLFFTIFFYSKMISYWFLMMNTAKEDEDMEYTKLIETIVATEQAAAKLTQDAEANCAGQEQELISEIARIKERSMDEARRRVFELEQETKRHTASELAALDDAHAAALSHLDSAEQKEQGQWVEQLLHKIIGVPPLHEDSRKT
jgi:cell division protein FtsB